MSMNDEIFSGVLRDSFTQEQFAKVVRAAKTLEQQARDLFMEIGNLHFLIDDPDVANVGVSMLDTVTGLARFRDRLERAADRAFPGSDKKLEKGG